MASPTTKEISDNIIAAFETKFGQDISILEKAFLRITAKVLAGLYIVLYKYAGFLGLQMFVSSVSATETEINGRTIIPLIELGDQIGVSAPKIATAAELEIEITVTNQSGFLPEGEALLGEKNNITYLTIGSTLLNAAIVTATVIAVADETGGDGAGAIGNLDNGDTINFINPIANVAQPTIVTDTIITGANGEDLDTEYRARVAEVRQKPPQGGAYADYVIWGTEAAGIINIYPYTGDPGEVDIYSEATIESSGNPDGIPTLAQLADVLEKIEFDIITDLPNRRPASSFVNSLPITRLGFEVVIDGLIVDNEGLVRDEIESALTQYFLDREPFIPGLSILPRKDRITQTAIGGVVEEIVNDFGGVFSGVFFKLNGFELPIYTLGEGQKAKLTGVVFT